MASRGESSPEIYLWVGDVVDGDGREHRFDGGTERGRGGVGGGGAPAMFLGEVRAGELREGLGKVMVGLNRGVQGREWEFHGERGSAGFTAAAAMFRGTGRLWVEMGGPGSCMGVNGSSLCARCGWRSGELGSPREPWFGGVGMGARRRWPFWVKGWGQA